MLKIKVTVKVILFSGLFFVTFFVASANATLSEAIDAYALKDYKTAYQLFLPLAKSGNQYAQFGLAKMYGSGEQIKDGQIEGKIDNLKAFKWYQKAADQEYGIAQNNLGLFFENGKGTQKNLEQAKAWYQRSCDNRCSHGCNNLQRLVFEQ